MASFGLKDIEDQLKLIENKLVQLKQEAVSGALLTIGFVHQMVHLGNMYRATHEFATVGQGATRNIIIDVASEHAHIQVKKFAQTSEDMRIELYRSPTIDTAGSDLDGVHNLNDGDGSAPTVTLSQEASVSANGTLLSRLGNPGGQKAGGRASILPDGPGFEFHTKANTTYMLKITNLSGSNTIDYIWADLIWYEH